jgi:hypothetical protein
MKKDKHEQLKYQAGFGELPTASTPEARHLSRLSLLFF